MREHENEGFLEKNRSGRRKKFSGNNRDRDHRIKRVEHKDKWKFNPTAYSEEDDYEEGEE